MSSKYEAPSKHHQRLHYPDTYSTGDVSSMAQHDGSRRPLLQSVNLTSRESYDLDQITLPPLEPLARACPPPPPLRHVKVVSTMDQGILPPVGARASEPISVQGVEISGLRRRTMADSGGLWWASLPSPRLIPSYQIRR